MVHTGARDYRPGFDGLVGFYHIDESPVLPGLDGFVGYHDRVRLSGKPQDDSYELARPKHAIGVGKSALELDGAGGHIHGVVNEGEGSVLLAAGFVLGSRAYGELTSLHKTLDGRQLGLGNREGHIDGLDLVDGHQFLAVRHDHVALLDGDIASAPVDGRSANGVTELHARVVRHRAAGTDGGAGAFDGRSIGG